jgi:uncharacterized protein involved in outer membrane biogenesis
VRVLARVVGGGVLLLAVMLLVLLLALPRMASSPSVRAELAAVAGSLLGYRFDFEELEFQLFPPTIVMRRARWFELEAREGDDVAGHFASAERMELVFAATPLLVGMVLIDSARVQGAHFEGVRTQGGFQFPQPRHHEPKPDNIMVRSVTLRNAVVLLADQTVSPPLIWKVVDLHAHLIGEAQDFSVAVELTGALESGGQLEAQGSWKLAGEVDFELDFDSVAIAAAEPYFESRSPVAGLLSGSLRGGGTLKNLTVVVEAACQGARLQLGEVELSGDLKVDAEIADAWLAPHGQIDLDATHAQLIYAGFFTKPAGKEAHVTASLSHGSDGSSSIDAWKFVMKELDARF